MFTPQTQTRINLPPTLAGVLKTSKGMIAGGYCISTLQARAGIQSQWNDIDVFFEYQNEYDHAFHKLQENGYRVTYENELSVQLQYRGFDKTVNLVKIIQSHKDTIKRFDFKNAQFWCMYPFKQIESNFTPKGVQYLLTHLKLNEPELTLQKIMRMEKYRRNKLLNMEQYEDQIIQYFLKYKTFTETDFMGAFYDSSEVKNSPQSVKNNYIGFVFYTLLLHLRDNFLELEKDTWLPFDFMDTDMSATFQEFKQSQFVLMDTQYGEQFSDKTNQEILVFMANYFPECLL